MKNKKINNKIRLRFLIFLIPLIMLNSAFAIERGISLNSRYNLGDMVYIDINEKYFTNNTLLEVTSNYFVYRFIDILSKPIKFIPKKSGNYSILLINKLDNSVIESFSFIVEREEEIEEEDKDLVFIVPHSSSEARTKEKESYPDKKKEICNIAINKKEYLLGESVVIYVSTEEGNKIYIISEKESYRYLGLINQSLKFIPRKIGSYTIEARDIEEKNVCSSDFVVRDNINNTYDYGKDGLLNKIVLRDNKNRAIKFNIRRIKAIEENKKTVGYQIQSETSIKPQKESIEVLPENMPIKSIRFNDLELGADINLGLDDAPEKIKKINDKDVVEIYAIDPTNLNFSNAIVTAQAKGRELYKCKDWDFAQQLCFGTWEKIKELVPGQEYSFTITQQDPGFGETGPPQPHTIRGRVFNSDGATGVENGIPVTINNTVSGDFVLTYTYAPPIPSLKGSYSANVNGSDSDTIIVTAWNSTAYGKNTTILAATTTYANVVLNTTRPSETNVTIITPANDSVKNTSYPFNVTANISIIGDRDGFSCNATISFSDNSVLNISSSESFTHILGDIALGATNTTTWNVSIRGIGVANISVQAECVNQTENLDHVNIDYVYNITIADTSPPFIRLISPENNSLARRNVTFFYNVTDHSMISNCSLVVNDTARVNSTDAQRDSTQNFTLFLDFGSYNYYINCTDNSSNYNRGSSETRFFNVSDMDLTLSSLDIVFSNQNPIENENVTINATIYDIGEENTTENFIMQFFEGDPETGGVQIDVDKTINGLNSSSNTTVSINWTAKQGTYNIYVIVDAPLATNGSIHEINESNNEANNTIFIPAYHTYYGNISADIALDSASNHSIFMWFNETQVSGNVFFIDSDSSITWTNLIALGINISGKNATNDFEEADDALSITGFSDSINATYTYNSYAKNLGSFLVYSINITNVPVVNSTDNLNFITGVLWDSSDINTGEYDGTQDLVFITKINNNAQGKYGVYDYEIKIPANLISYITPNNDNSVTIYTELR